MFSWSIRAFALWAILAGIMACSPPKHLEMRGFHGFRLERDKEEKKLTLQVGIDLFNPNPFAIKIRKYDFQLLLNQTEIAKAISRTPLKIPKGGHGTLALAVTTDIKSLAKGAIRLLADYFLGDQEVDFRVEGTLRMRQRGMWVTEIVNWAAPIGMHFP